MSELNNKTLCCCRILCTHSLPVRSILVSGPCQGIVLGDTSPFNTVVMPHTANSFQRLSIIICNTEQLAAGVCRPLVRRISVLRSKVRSRTSKCFSSSTTIAKTETHAILRSSLTLSIGNIFILRRSLQYPGSIKSTSMQLDTARLFPLSARYIHGRSAGFHHSN